MTLNERQMELVIAYLNVENKRLKRDLEVTDAWRKYHAAKEKMWFEKLFNIKVSNEGKD